MKKLMLLLIVAMFSMVTFAQGKKMAELKPDQLPKETTKWISQNLSGGTIVRAGKIEENGVLSYVAVVESKGQKHSYLFDKDGKFSGKADNLMNNKGQAPAGTKATATPAPPPPPKK